MLKKYIDGKTIVSGALGAVLASVVLLPAYTMLKSYFKIGA